MEAPEELVKRIRQVYPDLEVLDARLLDGESLSGPTVIVNDEVIFRFPSSATEIEPLRREAAALNALQGRLPLPIPQPEYVRLDAAQPDQVFLGYRRLQGLQLARRLSEGPISANTFQRIVSQMANFMHALHDVPPDLLGVELPRTETREETAQLLEEIRARLFPEMRPDAVMWVEHLFEPFLARPENFDYQPVLRHSRLNAENILVDPESGAVTGVLDFSALSLGDPAMDVAALASISEAFFAELYEVDKDAISRWMWRAQFYKSTFALREALTGARLGITAAYRRRMAAYLSPPVGMQAENPSPRTG